MSNAQEFISASGENDTLCLEDFYLYDIEALVCKAGRISLTRHFNATKIKLDTQDAQPIELEQNEASNIRIDYVNREF